jgi:hypothetical protein
VRYRDVRALVSGRYVPRVGNGRRAPQTPGTLHELPLLRVRALLPRADGNEADYRDYRDRYRALGGRWAGDGWDLADR